MGILEIISALVGLAKQAGLIKSPEDEAKLQQAALQAAAQSDSAFADFVKATQPQGVVVAGVPWFVNLIGAVQNFIVALIRPAISIFAAYQVYFHPNEYTTPLYLIPVIFWFTGRTVEKLMGASGFLSSDFNSAPGAGAATPSLDRKPVVVESGQSSDHSMGGDRG